MTFLINGVILLLSSSPSLAIIGKATLIATLGLIGAWLTRRSRAAVRHAVLAASFAVLLALPIASTLIAPVRIALPASAQELPQPALFPASTDAAQPAASMDGSAGVPSPSPRWREVSPSAVLLALWIAGAVFFLLRMVFGLQQVRALRQFGLPWRGGQSVVNRLAQDAGIHRRVEVLLHESLPAPVTCGIVRPAIVLPPDTQDWEHEDLNRAIVHELEHVRRFDWASHCLARLACAVYWFHPLVWAASRQLTLEAERSCDDAVLARSEATAYADQLVGLARRLSVAQPPALAMANRSDLSARVGSVLDGRRARGRAGALLVTVACAVATAVVLAMSPLRMVAAPQRETLPSDLHFEVASVKRSDPKAGGFGKRFSCDSKYCSVRGIPLFGLAFDAYGLKEDYQIEADPSKLPSDRYDIEATVPDGTTIEQAHVMLQRLLAERFGLVVHRETRQLPGFRLVVAKGGPKLTKAVDVPASTGPDIIRKDGIPQYSNSAKSGVLFTLEAEIIHGRHETMSGFVHQLVQAIREPVIDATGIEGEYDYDLSFESIAKPQAKGVVYQGLQPAPQAGPALPTDPMGSDHPTIFNLIKQQLGLQLDAAKSIPVEVVVLDKANREPTGN